MEDDNTMRDKHSINFEQGSRASVTFQRDTDLHIAARRGNLTRVTEILKLNGLLVDQPSLVTDQHSPLPDQSTNQPSALADQHSPLTDLRAPNKFGETPLIIACKHGHKEIVDKLLEAHDHTAAYEQGASSLLHAAVHGGCVEIVKAILNHRVDDRAWHIELMTEEDKSGRCAIHVAAMKGYLDIINEFLRVMPNCVEIRSTDEKSVLHFAVECNQIGIVRMLLENKEEDTVKRLVSRDHDHLHNTALHLAAKNGVNPQVLKILLRGSVANIDAVNDEGMTALDIASAEAQRNPNCAIIARKLKHVAAQRNPNCAIIAWRLKDAGGIRSKSSNSKQEKDTNSINTHMIVASLIASVTFAAMFQVPGGFEDNKDSITFGAAKLGCTYHFHWFLISDTAAFTSSIAMVVVSSVDIYLEESALASLMCGLILPFSVIWTIVAFVFATLITMEPVTYTLVSPADLESVLRYECQYNKVVHNVIFVAACPPVFSAIYFVTFIFVRRIFLLRKSCMEKPLVFGYMVIMLLFNMYVGLSWA